MSRAARARDNHTLSYLVLLMYQLTILQLLSRLYRLKIIARALRDRWNLRPLVTTVATVATVTTASPLPVLPTDPALRLKNMPMARQEG
jgi:hypothetical protein